MDGADYVRAAVLAFQIACFAAVAGVFVAVIKGERK